MTHRDRSDPPGRGERADLEILANGLAIHVRHAVQAAIVTTAARAQFHENRAWFRTHPANTFTYAAMRALEEQSIVSISEQVAEYEHVWGAFPSLRRKRALKKHRHAISHPAKFAWGEAYMREFHADGRADVEMRTALVWDLQKSIDERLVELGGKAQLGGVDVLIGMASASRQIQRSSLKPEHLHGQPDEGAYLAPLQRYRDSFIEFLERHPSGETEEMLEFIRERRERLEARRLAIAASRRGAEDE